VGGVDNKGPQTLENRGVEHGNATEQLMQSLFLRVQIKCCDRISYRCTPLIVF